MKTQLTINELRAKKIPSLMIVLLATMVIILHSHVSKACYGVKLNTPITVTNKLTLTYSHLYTDATNLLTMETAATTQDAKNTSYVCGPMIKKVVSGASTFDFPVGKDYNNSTGMNGELRQIGIKDPNATGSFKAEYIKKAPSVDGYGTAAAQIVGGGTGTINHVGKNEYWVLSQASGTPGAKVRLSWGVYTGSGAVNDMNNIIITHWNGTQWEPTAGGGTATLEVGSTNSAGMVTTTGTQTSFSPFGIASKNANNPLPIELLNFEGELVKDEIKLDWTTASEINNDYFTIEKSKDGKGGFVIVGQVKGAGTSTEPHNYSLNDPRPYKGTNYYRLKQTDYDKTNTYSDVIAVDYMPKTWGNVSVYPNPANDRIMVEAVVTEDKDVTIEITDVLGKTVKESKHSLNEGKNTVKIDLSEQANGVYMIYIKDKATNEVITIQKFTKGQ